MVTVVKKLAMVFNMLALLTCFIFVSFGDNYDKNLAFRHVLLKIRFKEPHHEEETVLNGNGKYAKQSPHSAEHGYLYHAGPKDTWCKQTICIDKILSPWIALIPRENDTCTITEKVGEARRLNASAVIVYNNINDEIPVIMENVYSMETVMIDLKTGKEYARLLDTVPRRRLFCEIVGTRYVVRWNMTDTFVLVFVVGALIVVGFLAYVAMARRYKHRKVVR